MTLSCPNCGPMVSVSSRNVTNREVCPRCLEHSSGTLPVPLGPAAALSQVEPQDRVRELLQGGPATAA